MSDNTINTPVSLHRDGEIGLITVDNPPVNALSHAVREGIWRCLDEAAADDSIDAIVLRCAGRTFIAGADIREFGKPPEDPWLPELLNKLDAFPKLSVAAIHGTALGGGLETALSCHYRIADVDARVGLPESQLGLLPGAGGTQRLPRLIGAEAALDMMISGKPVAAPRAQELGIVDRLVKQQSLDQAAIAYAREQLADNAPLRRASQQTAPAVADDFFDDYARNLGKRYRGFESPGRIIDAVRAATELPFDDGLKRERERFTEAMASTESAAMRHLFFAERACAKVPGIDRSTPTRTIQSVGVIGAGTMGAGIALACISRGIDVILTDNNDEGLARGRDTIDKLLSAQVRKGRISAEAAAGAREHLETGTGLEHLSECDLVIEAVFESMAVKEAVFGELDRICKDGAILATNTSTLSIDRIAAATKRPHDVIGLHFFSPANIMRLLEIVRGEATGDDV
ncbi:MAG: 3-hydroxyacyl-CoA dehydrogenase, partial [Gammaproteobacteria bacterium]|nr:3-hydroxyacyl-CoA dehydrogenase [Gammaproteobacteria bacterium]